MQLRLKFREVAGHSRCRASLMWKSRMIVSSLSRSERALSPALPLLLPARMDAMCNLWTWANRSMCMCATTTEDRARGGKLQLNERRRRAQTLRETIPEDLRQQHIAERIWERVQSKFGPSSFCQSCWLKVGRCMCPGASIPVGDMAAFPHRIILYVHAKVHPFFRCGRTD